MLKFPQLWKRNMAPKVKMRLQWVQHYQQTRNAGLTCRRCGITRPTLRKWVQRLALLQKLALTQNLLT